MRKKCTVFLLCLTLAQAGVWAAVRWSHFKMLTGSGAVVRWLPEGEAWLWRRPLEVDLNEADVEPRSAGAALAHYSSVRTVTLRRNTAAWLDGCFAKWRDRRSVEVLLVMYSDFNDGHMAGFATASFKRAVFNNTDMSGEVFPLCPLLTQMEFNGTPVTDRGLRNLAVKCPGLQQLWLHTTGVTAAGVRDSGLLQAPALKALHVAGTGGSEAEVAELKKLAAQANPGLRLVWGDG